ncbi:class I SAM-dependent methyltransferase [Psychroflexus aestuariivivens]|uniref:class I SAM-dependent methyltransferase n=1 Tax=Psychroflexus aestuariivivens TaxID=1795040 RepID=UPI000FD82DE7|nr:class I SAM-dependent methyltransferase [Psychroflexus aestuariivivens]
MKNFSYLKFLLSSKNQHGIHSPFVYKLITECFYDKTQYEAYKDISSLKKSLPKFTKTPSLKRLKFLFRLVNYLNISSVLEIGKSSGISSLTMSLSASEVRKIDGSNAAFDFLSKKNTQIQFQNIKVLQQKFSEYAAQIPQSKTFDLVFVNQCENTEICQAYFQKLLKHYHNDTVFIFDAIYSSEAMQNVWSNIKSHPEVRVTIDTFRWGLVFFRTEQVKQNFKIRL